MSYMSGFMMGASMGKNLHDFFIHENTSKSGAERSYLFQGASFVILHALPGRRRYHAGGLLHNEANAVLLEQQLSQLKFMDCVKASSVTGSLLLVYSCTEKQIDWLVKWLQRHIFFTSALQQRREGLAESGKSLQRTTGAVNEWLKGHTGNWFDLNSILSIVFLVRGLRKILIFHQRPSGPQMLWWAVSLLKGWRMT